jgi:carbon monoxide dehydrogenase subunit G
MQLEHSFAVPVGVEDAWKVLLDIELIAPCMPGAAIDSVDGDDFTGSVKVKLGPIGLTYKGKASFVEKDAAIHRAVIDARGRDSRGNGTANAKITATLTEDGSSTTVHVLTDLDITGKPAQFGRGVMVDVGNKLIGQFADCLAGKLAQGGDAEVAAAEPPTVDTSVAEEATVRPANGAHAVREVQPPTAEAINLIESAGPAIAKRLAPLALVAIVLFVVLRRRSRS